MNPNRAIFRSLSLGLFLASVYALWEIPARACPEGQGPGAGIVLAIGGGPTPRSAIREALSRLRARGSEPISVVVVAYASKAEGRGEPSAAMWLEEGAAAAVVAPEDAATAAKLMAAADVIWMGGGDQGRLLDDLERMELLDDVRAAHSRGALVGGTSAGAAVLGSVCIAGTPEPDVYVVGAMEGRAGLGLLPNTIIDQHFRERRREGRLLTAVLDAGGALGYGVSESTALFFEGGALSVMGSGVVVVLDAREAEIPHTSDAAGELRSATGIRTSILRP